MLLRRLLLVLLGLVVGFGAAEFAVRTLVRVDADGQRWLGEQRLLPWRLPVERIGARLRDLNNPASLLRYDAELGWEPRPGARSRDGLVSIDERGVRRDGLPVAQEGIPLRIVTVGDSFTFGAEVGDAESWSAQLGELLRARGVAAEVINLGVNGYGIDQAVLRFERDGVPFAPDVVVLGLQPENLMRGLGLFRPFLFPDTNVPLSKPRFVAEGEGFTLVNQPTLALREVPKIVDDPSAFELLAHERWLDERYRDSPRYRSSLISLAESFFATRGARNAAFRLTPEMAAVGTHAIERLAEAASASGARLVLVHTPRRHDLQTIRQGGPVWYKSWLDEIDGRYELVRAEFELDPADERFRPRGHYDAAQNRRVARALVGPLVAPLVAPPADDLQAAGGGPS